MAHKGTEPQSRFVHHQVTKCTKEQLRARARHELGALGVLVANSSVALRLCVPIFFLTRARKLPVDLCRAGTRAAARLGVFLGEQ